MMSISDYVHALQVCRQQTLLNVELVNNSIADMMTSRSVTFCHAEFESIDAEDSVYQLYMLLERSGAVFIPIVDPDEGNLVSVLGYLDLAHLLNEASKHHPKVFSTTVEALGIRTTMTASSKTKLYKIIDLIQAHKLIGLTIIDDNNQVIGFYHKNDVTFITKAIDHDGIMRNLNDCTVGEIIYLQQNLTLPSSNSLITNNPTGDYQQANISSTSAAILPKVYPLITCQRTDTLQAVVASYMAARSTTAVCVDEANRFLGTISIQDIVNYYFRISSETVPTR